MATRQLRVELVGDTKSLDRALGRTETRLSRFGNRVGLKSGRGGGVFGAIGKGGLIGAGVAVGAGLVAKQVGVLTKAGSDLNEQITKSEAVFGASARMVEDWSKTTAKSFGISRTAALEASGTFGNLFGAVGIKGGKSAEMSKRLVGLAADLASFNNADPSDTLAALRSGLIGEAEPLRRFGVLLSETRVQQLAMQMTGKTTAKALTDQEKATARYNIILKDTVTAQGDFSRTSGGLANQQRILSARFADVQARLGTKLLPMMVKLTAATIRLIDWAEKNWPRFSRAISQAYQTAKPVIDNLVDRVKGIAKTIEGVVNIIQGIKNGEWSQVWKGMGQVVDGAVKYMVAAFIKLPLMLAKALGKAGLGAIRAAFTAYLNKYIDILNGIIGGINKVSPFGDIPKIGHIGGGKTPTQAPSPSGGATAPKGLSGPVGPQVVNLVVDGRVLASVVTAEQQKSGRQQAPQSRGRQLPHGV